MGRRRGAKCVRRPGKSHTSPAFSNFCSRIPKTLPLRPRFSRLGCFDEVAVRKKLRGIRPAWRRRLVSEVPGNAGDHLKSCPRRFQHFPDSPQGSVNANGHRQPGNLCGPPGVSGIGPMKIA
eukprot:365956-Chlamydomonas_euryale.AAC.10